MAGSSIRWNDDQKRLCRQGTLCWLNQKSNDSLTYPMTTKLYAVIQSLYPLPLYFLQSITTEQFEFKRKQIQINLLVTWLTHKKTCVRNTQQVTCFPNYVTGFLHGIHSTRVRPSLHASRECLSFCAAWDDNHSRRNDRPRTMILRQCIHSGLRNRTSKTIRRARDMISTWKLLWLWSSAPPEPRTHALTSPSPLAHSPRAYTH